MDTYVVQMHPWEKGFELHITGPFGFTGVTQSHGEDDAEQMARDYIALDREIPADSFAVTLHKV